MGGVDTFFKGFATGINHRTVFSQSFATVFLHMPRFLTIAANHCVWGFVIAIIVVSTKLSAEISFERWLTVSKADCIDSGNFVVL